MSGTDSSLRMWAGSAFADRNNAPFRVYDNGYAMLMNAYLQGEVYADSGRIGALYISQDGLSVTEFPSDLSLGSVFGALILAKNQVSFSTMVKETENTGTSIRSVQINLKDRGTDIPALLVDSSRSSNGKNIGIKCTNGMFSGLRPMTRVITSGMSSSSRNNLTEFDFSVLVFISSGTCYIRLPLTPLDGQEYHIESKGAAINIISPSGTIYPLATGTTVASNTAYTIAEGRRLMRFKYYATASQWTVSQLN